MWKKLSCAILFVIASLPASGCGRRDQPKKVEGPEGKEVSLNYPRKVEIEAGSTATVKVSVERKKLEGSTEIVFESLPDGIEIVEKDFTLPASVKEAAYTFKAKEDMAPKADHVVKVSAKADGLKAGPYDITLSVKNTVAEFNAKKEEFKKRMADKMKEVDGLISDLQEKAKDATGDVKAAAEKELENLQARRKALASRAEELKSTTKEAWAEFARGVNNSFEELTAGTKKALARFK